jgi:hypothetical protein
MYFYEHHYSQNYDYHPLGVLLYLYYPGHLLFRKDEITIIKIITQSIYHKR